MMTSSRAHEQRDAPTEGRRSVTPSRPAMHRTPQAASMLRMQRLAGNRAVQTLVRPGLRSTPTATVASGVGTLPAEHDAAEATETSEPTKAKSRREEPIASGAGAPEETAPTAAGSDNRHAEPEPGPESYAHVVEPPVDDDTRPSVQRWSIRGAWESVKSGASRVGSAVSSGFSKLTAGAKRLYNGAKNRIGGIVGKVRSGWQGLKDRARAAYHSVRSGFNRAKSAVKRTASRVGSAITSAFGNAKAFVSGLADAAKKRIGAAVGKVRAAFAAIKSAALGFEAGAFVAAWNRAKDVVGSITSGAGSVASWVGSKISGAWTGLTSRTASLLSGASRMAGSVTGKVRQLASKMGTTLGSVWNGIKAGASGLSSVLAGLPGPVRSLVSSLARGAMSIWGRVTKGWDNLRSKAGALAGQIAAASRRVWDGLKRGLGKVRDGASRLWHKASSAVRRGVGRLVDGVKSVGSRIGSMGSGFLDKITGTFQGVKAVRAGLADPEGAMAPIVDGVAQQLQAGMPAAAQSEAATRMGGVGMNVPSEAATATGPAVQRIAELTVSRQSRSTAWGSIWSGFTTALGEKWAKLDVWQMVKHVVKSLIWPWPDVGREFQDMWKEWQATWSGFHLGRNPLSDPLGFLHDFYGQLMRVVDLVMTLWRHVNNILLLLWGWVTIALVILGAVGGAVAGGVIGGILSAAASLGIATPAGGAAGAGAGGLAGASAGLSAALAIGQVLVVSFAAAEGANFVKRMLDLATVAQTDSEKEDDFNAAADSVLGLGILAVLLTLAFVAGRIAAAAIKRFPKIVPDFLRRPKPVEDVPPPEVKPGEVKPGETKPGEVKPGEPPRSIAEMRERLSPEGKDGFDQIRELQGEKAAEGQSNKFRRDDGTFDVDAADQYFKDKRLTPEEFEAKLAKREAQATQMADKDIKTIDNQIKQTSPEGRPGATIGDGTSEAALIHEAQTGRPVGGRGHAIKVRDAIGSLRSAAERLRNNLPKIRDADMRAKMEEAITRAEAKAAKMDPALDTWYNRAKQFPDKWNPDGTSRVTTNPDGTPWPSESHRMVDNLR